MNKKYILGLVILLLVVIGAVVIFGQAENGLFDTPLVETREATLEESREIAEDWVMNQSPTYTYDGSDLSLVSEEEFVAGSRYSFVFTFVSTTAGYGDRSDQIVAQVITPHTIEVIVENGRVVSAITDGVYDELNDRMIDDAQPTDPADSGITDINQETPDTLSINLYFVETAGGQERLVSVEREIPYTVSTGREAIERLLQGPTAQERAQGVSTSIPEGTQLQGIDIQDGTAVVDFSPELDEGVAGSAMVTAIRQQIERTLLQFDTVSEVVISINGRIDDVLQP
jgi:spore germination protein GerM